MEKGHLFPGTPLQVGKEGMADHLFIPITANLSDNPPPSFLPKPTLFSCASPNLARCSRNRSLSSKRRPTTSCAAAAESTTSTPGKGCVRRAWRDSVHQYKCIIGSVQQYSDIQSTTCKTGGGRVRRAWRDSGAKGHNLHQ